jgi:hypothetical protein
VPLVQQPKKNVHRATSPLRDGELCFHSVINHHRVDCGAEVGSNRFERRTVHRPFREPPMRGSPTSVMKRQSGQRWRDEEYPSSTPRLIANLSEARAFLTMNDVMFVKAVTIGGIGARIDQRVEDGLRRLSRTRTTMISVMRSPAARDPVASTSTTTNDSV